MKIGPGKGRNKCRQALAEKWEMHLFPFLSCSCVLASISLFYFSLFRTLCCKIRSLFCLMSPESLCWSRVDTRLEILPPATPCEYGHTSLFPVEADPCLDEYILKSTRGFPYGRRVEAREHL